MELFLSKLLPLFIYPLGLSILLAIVAVAFFSWKRRRPGIAIPSLSVIILWMSSTPALSDYLRARLERSYLPVAVSESPVADAIVILGGAVGGANFPRIDTDLGDASDRVLHAARLYQAGKAPVVIAVGGSIPWLGTAIPESLAMSGLLQEWGVPEQAIILEGESVNTYQNAINTRRLMDERGLKRVLLVTSALHMPRALATFRAVGVDALPSPTDYKVVNKEERTILDFLPEAEALLGTTRAMKEYLGLVVYRWRGWIR